MSFYDLPYFVDSSVVSVNRLPQTTAFPFTNITGGWLPGDEQAEPWRPRIARPGYRQHPLGRQRGMGRSQPAAMRTEAPRRAQAPRPKPEVPPPSISQQDAKAARREALAVRASNV